MRPGNAILLNGVSSANREIGVPERIATGMTPFASTGAAYFGLPNVSRKPVERSRSFPLIPVGGLLIKLSFKLNCQPSHLLIAVEKTVLNVYR